MSAGVRAGDTVLDMCLLRVDVSRIVAFDESVWKSVVHAATNYVSRRDGI